MAIDPSRRIPAALLLFLSFSSLALGAVAFWYLPLLCDGAWYSYPAFEWAERGTVGGNMLPPSDQPADGGLRSSFGFATFESLRVFYTAGWFALFSSSIYSLKILSVVEFGLLLGALYVALADFLASRWSRLFVVALFANDKTVLLSAVQDSRPDLAVAMFALLLLYVVNRPRTLPWTLGALVLAVLLPLVHVTTAIPLLAVASYVVLKDLFERRPLVSGFAFATALGLAFLATFMLRPSIFAQTMPVVPGIDSFTQFVYTRVATMFDWGGSAFLSKEAQRWGRYFFTTNVAALLVLIAGIGFAVQAYRKRRPDRHRAAALLLASLVAVLALTIVDPHPADTHGIAASPFFYLLFGAGLDGLGQRGAGAPRAAAIGIAALAGVASLALATKIAHQGIESGHDLLSMERALRMVESDDRSRSIVIGPTELYPFLDRRKDTLLVDNSRSASSFSSVAPMLGQVAFVVLNADYDAYGWRPKFLAAFPEYELVDVAVIGNPNGGFTVSRLRRR